MKRTLLAVFLLTLMMGCNESKEGRIQKLESEMKRTSNELQVLQQRVEALEKIETKETNQEDPAG